MIKHEFHEDLNVLHVRALGRIDLEAWREYIREVTGGGVVREGTVIYWDLSEATVDFDSESVSELQLAYKPLIDLGWRGSLVYAPHDHSFGITRMNQMMREGRQKDSEGLIYATREPVALDQVRSALARQESERL